MSGGYAISMFDAIRLSIVASTIHAINDQDLPKGQPRREPVS